MITAMVGEVRPWDFYDSVVIHFATELPNPHEIPDEHLFSSVFDEAIAYAMRLERLSNYLVKHFTQEAVLENYLSCEADFSFVKVVYKDKFSVEGHYDKEGKIVVNVEEF